MSRSHPRSSRRTAPVYDAPIGNRALRLTIPPMRLSLAAGAVAVAGLLLLGMAGPAHRLGVPLGTAFSVVRWSAYLALAGALLSAGAVFWARRKSRRWPAAVAAAGVVLGILTAAVGYAWLRVALGAPALHDITTDLEN